MSSKPARLEQRRGVDDELRAALGLKPRRRKHDALMRRRAPAFAHLGNTLPADSFGRELREIQTGPHDPEPRQRGGEDFGGAVRGVL